MEISRFDYVSPLTSRYLSEDEELMNKIREYRSLDVFFKIKRFVPEIVIPRVCLLEKRFLGIARENESKQVPRRINGRHEGVISIGEIFRNYEERLRNRRERLQKLSLDFNVDEAIRNDIIFDLVSGSVSILGVEASVANDIRQRFRSEIGEYTYVHAFDSNSVIVGSSTMPHKVNPKDFEKVVSFWKNYFPKINITAMGQIVEHEGDSTNEELPYHTFELLCALGYITENFNDSLKSLKVLV